MRIQQIGITSLPREITTRILAVQAHEPETTRVMRTTMVVATRFTQDHEGDSTITIAMVTKPTFPKEMGGECTE